MQTELLSTLELKVDYRKILIGELDRKKKLNARFSLRQFAKRLGLSPAFLSKVLRGEKNLSLTTAQKIVKSLGLSENQSKAFCRNVLIGDSINDVTSSIEAPQMRNSLELELTRFQTISDWYHFALRELVETEDFRFDFSWMAERLGLEKVQAEEGFLRLVKLNLVKHNGHKWIKTDDYLKVRSTGPNLALRNHHAQMITKGLEALQTQNFEERDITSITIPGDPKRLDQARELIREFRLKIAELQEGGSAEDVYQLNIQYFKLTKMKSFKNRKKNGV